MALIKCPECGKEISDRSKMCIHCGYPLEEEAIEAAYVKCPECGQDVPNDADTCTYCGYPIKIQEPMIRNDNIPMSIQNHIPEQLNIKAISIAGIVIAIVIICIIIYNIKVIQPRKNEEQNNTIYEEAIELLEKGKYEEGNELLQSIVGYKDVDTVLEQIKWESYTYECINDFKTWLKNPDSFTLYEVVFYLDDEPHGMYSSILGDVDFSYPAIVFRSGAQNGFGGNTTGYELFYYFKDGGYTCVGSCDSLDEDEYYNDKGELKDEDDGAMKVLLCKEINELKKEAKQVGEVDMGRIKSIIKNDSYSTIKIIE